ncbi:hypothetical protein IL45_10235 [Nonlabens ulvanivorans]|uniref:M23ase beta-sheet core domain-containing protein n=1 Tax=Nonlabens ulvanivorans TaxID=906888 RepID=A0A084JU84_NONUL|nr:hypothetical protein IL45_10235 [Nonlabens ulvanivorans]
MIAVTSCEKDDDLYTIDNITIKQKMTGSRTSLSQIKRENHDLFNFISDRALSIAKSSNSSNGTILDTTHIQVLEGVDFKNYIFKVTQDSTTRSNELKNYMLVILKDSIQHQYMVTYPYINSVIDTTNVLIEPVYGTDILNQVNLKCGGGSYQSVWIPGGYVDNRCQSGEHDVDDGPGNGGADGCKYYGGKGSASRLYYEGYFTTQYVEQQPCETIDPGNPGNGGGGPVGDVPPPPDDNSDDDDDNNVDEEPDITVGVTPNDGDVLDPVDDDDCDLVCPNNEKLDPEKCECIPEDCEYKTGYLHESAFTNSTATIGDNTTSSQDNFRNENGEIIDETNCDTGKIDSDSEVNVTGEKEERSYVKDDGTTALAFYYPIEYLDCPKGNSPTNKDYDSTKPCSDCDHGDPVLNPEIQEQLTVCGKKGGMYGKTRGVPSCNTQKHGGMDIANAQGNAVYAMFDGTASLATQTSGAGYYVIITSDYGDDKIKTMYFHLAENTRVTGDVKAGDIIGYQSNSGNLQNGIDEGTTESHVHIKVKLKQNGTSSYSAVDPINYFKTIFNNTTGEVTTSGCD